VFNEESLRLGSGSDIIESPIKKCAGVRACKSSKSDVKGHNGRELLSGQE